MTIWEVQFFSSDIDLLLQSQKAYNSFSSKILRIINLWKIPETYYGTQYCYFFKNFSKKVSKEKNITTSPAFSTRINLKNYECVGRSWCFASRTPGAPCGKLKFMIHIFSATFGAPKMTGSWSRVPKKKDVKNTLLTFDPIL